MVYYLLLAASVILAVCKSSLYNAYSKKGELSLFKLFAFNGITYGVAAAISFAGVLFTSWHFSLSTVVCAFFYALIVISLQTVSITAMSVGTMATTSACVMYGMIIPSVAGPLFWHESIGLLQIVGMILMLISLWLIKEKTSPVKRSFKTKWSVLAIIAFLLSGMAGLMEKIHQSTEGKDERLQFVFVACGFMLVFSLAAIMITGKKKKGGFSKSTVGIALLSGLVVGLYSTVNLVLSGKLDSMIYYPIANGGAMLLTVAASAVFFKERFGFLKLVGLTIGLVGILCLSIPL